MRLRTTVKLTALIATIMGFVGMTATSAIAATIYWEGATGDWGTGTSNNWSTSSSATTAGLVSVPGVSDIAAFNISSVNASTTVNLQGDKSALGMVITSTGAVSVRGGLANSTLTLGASGILKTGTGGGTSFGSTGANNNVTLLLAANQAWTNNNGGTGVSLRIDGPVAVSPTLSNAAIVLTLNGSNNAATGITGLAGVISDGTGSGNTLSIVKEDGGAWSLASTTATGLGQHTFTGGVTVTAGTLSVSGASSNGGFTAGPLGVGTLTMNGGILLGSDTAVAAAGSTNTLANPVTLNAVSGSTFRVVNGSSATPATALSTTTLSGSVGGAGGFTKTGTGVLVLSSASNPYLGNTTVSAGGITGTLKLANASSTNSIPNSPVVTVDGILDVTGLMNGTIALSAGQVIKGTGLVNGIVGGAGTVQPGASPGILSTIATDPSGGLDYSFEMTALGDPTWSNTGASVNDVFRLVDPTAPIISAMSGSNTVSVNFAMALSADDVIRGGFFTDANVNFSSLVSSADWQFTFTGGSIPSGYTITPSVTQVSNADFLSGSIANGWVTTFTVTPVPEPTALSLAIFGLLGLARYNKKRRG